MSYLKYSFQLLLLLVVVSALTCNTEESDDIGSPTVIKPVTDFRAEPGEQQIELTWNNPDFPGFEGVVIIRSDIEYATSVQMGEEIYRGFGTNYVDMQVADDVLYYYSIFAFDVAETFSAPLFASAKPVDSGDALPFQLFMSPSGSDDNDGLSRENALLTLSGVQQKLIEYKPILDQDIEVRIEFVDNTASIGQTVDWVHTSTN